MYGIRMQEHPNKRQNDIADNIRHQQGLGQTPKITTGHISAVRNAEPNHPIGGLVAQYANPDQLASLPPWARLVHSITNSPSEATPTYVNNAGAQQAQTRPAPFSYAPLQGGQQFYFQQPQQQMSGLLNFSQPSFDLPQYGLLTNV